MQNKDADENNVGENQDSGIKKSITEKKETHVSPVWPVDNGRSEDEQRHVSSYRGWGVNRIL
jgi:hypothetical protein